MSSYPIGEVPALYRFRFKEPAHRWRLWEEPCGRL